MKSQVKEDKDAQKWYAVEAKTGLLALSHGKLNTPKLLEIKHYWVLTY